jgi:hypothetical protein
MPLNLPPIRGGQHENCQLSRAEILLVLEILIRGYKDLEASFGRPQQIAVFQIGPAQLERGGNFVGCKRTAQRCGRALIEEDGTAKVCSRATPGNHSRNWSTVAPPSRFSKSAETGTRVPLNTHAPLTLPGTRSTAEHWVQSNMRGKLRRWPDTGKRQAELECFERDNLVAALEAANWKISGPDSAAELLGVKPTTLLSRMSKWGVNRPSPNQPESAEWPFARGGLEESWHGRPAAFLAGQIPGHRRRGGSDGETAGIPVLAAEIVVARQRMAEVTTTSAQ